MKNLKNGRRKKKKEKKKKERKKKKRERRPKNHVLKFVGKKKISYLAHVTQRRGRKKKRVI